MKPLDTLASFTQDNVSEMHPRERLCVSTVQILKQTMLGNIAYFAYFEISVFFRFFKFLGLIWGAVNPV